MMFNMVGSCRLLCGLATLPLSEDPNTSKRKKHKITLKALKQFKAVVTVTLFFFFTKHK